MAWRRLTSEERELFDKTIGSKFTKIGSILVIAIPIVILLIFSCLLPTVFASDLLIGGIVFVMLIIGLIFYWKKLKSIFAHSDSASSDKLFIGEFEVIDKGFHRHQRANGDTFSYYIIIKFDAMGDGDVSDEEISVSRETFDKIERGNAIKIVKYGDDCSDFSYLECAE
ncbi:hypothetical protein J6A31_05615 [bacterium]|nr:hypothetical protein [bacterium]